MMYRKVGDSVVLNPDQSFDSISSVIWRHQTEPVLQWFGEQITCFSGFKGRCDLDKKTGSLIINNLTQEDSNIYRPEINGKQLNKKKLRVLQPVPEPSVSIQCNSINTVCDLICGANIGSEFEPVTYKWKSGDKVLSNDKKLSITLVNLQKSFICTVENPVSSESSEEVENLLRKQLVAVVLGSLSGIAFIIAVIGLGVCLSLEDDVGVIVCLSLIGIPLFPVTIIILIVVYADEAHEKDFHWAVITLGILFFPVTTFILIGMHAYTEGKAQRAGIVLAVMVTLVFFPFVILILVGVIATIIYKKEISCLRPNEVI